MSELSKFSLDYAKTIYDNERKREESFIRQAGYIQVVNLILLVAIFVIWKIVTDCTTLETHYTTPVFSSIITLILLSLFFATLSQQKTKRIDYPQIKDAIFQINSNSNRLATKEQINNYLIDLYIELQEAVTKKISTREKFLKISTIIFYISILVSIVWFILTIVLHFFMG